MQLTSGIALTSSLAIVGLTTILGAGNELTDLAKAGGTLGGQALLFLMVFALTWTVVYLFKSQAKTTAEALTASNKQREEDRRHHEELVELFRLERSDNSTSQSANFQIILTIARDSAVAMTAAADATRNAATIGRETAAAIRDLSIAFREMRDTAHEDAGKPRLAKIINAPEEPVPVAQKS